MLGQISSPESIIHKDYGCLVNRVACRVTQPHCAPLYCLFRLEVVKELADDRKLKPSL